MKTVARLLLVWGVIFAAGFVGLGLYDLAEADRENVKYKGLAFKWVYSNQTRHHKTAYLILGAGAAFLLVNGFVVRGRKPAGTSDPLVVHPAGRLELRQKVAPLDVELDKHGNAPVADEGKPEPTSSA